MTVVYGTTNVIAGNSGSYGKLGTSMEKYKVTEIVPGKLPSGESVPNTYQVSNLETGEIELSTESKDEALNYYNNVSTLSGKADEPNLAKTKSNNGKTVEVNQPTPPKGLNSSISHQNNGPSLAKVTQGVLANTMTEINNVIPVAGCPIKLPNLLGKINTKFKLFPQVETNRLKEWGEKLGEMIMPILDQINSWIKAIKKMIDEIMSYVKEIMNLIKDIQEWIKLTMDFVNFIMSLPGRLAQLVSNCLSALMKGVSSFVSDSFNNFTSGFSKGAGLSVSDASSVTNLSQTGIPMNSTSGKYSSPNTNNTSGVLNPNEPVELHSIPKLTP